MKRINTIKTKHKMMHNLIKMLQITYYNNFTKYKNEKNDSHGKKNFIQLCSQKLVAPSYLNLLELFLLLLPTSCYAFYLLDYKQLAVVLMNCMLGHLYVWSRQSIQDVSEKMQRQHLN